MASNFIVEPDAFFSQANKPRTITIKPTGVNTGDTIIRKQLRISASGYKEDRIVYLIHQAYKHLAPSGV